MVVCATVLARIRILMFFASLTNFRLILCALRQGELERCAKRLFVGCSRMVGSSRTDGGAHAYGQVGGGAGFRGEGRARACCFIGTGGGLTCMRRAPRATLFKAS
jgi:hypothetical protein